MSAGNGKKSGGRFRILMRRLGLAVLVGGALLVFVGLPARRDAAEHARLAAELEAGCQGMERWAMDGDAISVAVAEREARVADLWRRLFPAEKGKDRLFLELARVADASGVSDFFLAEAGQEMGDGGFTAAQTVTEDGPPMDGPMDGSMGDEAGGPAVAVEGFLVRTRFESDMAGAARFLAGLESVERALQVREIRIREGGRRLIVEMEMEFYVSKEA